MAVARTYEKYQIKGEPFKENGHYYVYVIAPKGEKKVRWYSDAERARMDKAAGITVKEPDIMDFNARHTFGFGKLGYITLYKGKEEEIEIFVEQHQEWFRRNLTFGYYTPSFITINDYPSSITPIKLAWNDIMSHDDRMKPHEEVKKYVDSLLILDDARTSQYQGNENEWLQKAVTVREKKSNETHFGTKHTYYLVDAEGNTYIWETGAKDYARDSSVSLKMKVKAHKEINGEKCTVVWYCKEV